MMNLKSLIFAACVCLFGAAAASAQATTFDLSGTASYTESDAWVDAFGLDRSAPGTTDFLASFDFDLNLTCADADSCFAGASANDATYRGEGGSITVGGNTITFTRVTVSVLQGVSSARSSVFIVGQGKGIAVEFEVMDSSTLFTSVDLGEAAKITQITSFREGTFASSFFGLLDNSAEVSTRDFDIAVSSVAAPTPEPGTWIMMLVGFALVGSALSRRRAADLVSARLS